MNKLEASKQIMNDINHKLLTAKYIEDKIEETARYSSL